MKACQQLSQQVFSLTHTRAAYLYIKKKREGNPVQKPLTHGSHLASILNILELGRGYLSSKA
jgi:hypothetical protein